MVHHKDLHSVKGELSTIQIITRLTCTMNQLSQEYYLKRWIYCKKKDYRDEVCILIIKRKNRKIKKMYKYKWMIPGYPGVPSQWCCNFSLPVVEIKHSHKVQI